MISEKYPLKTIVNGMFQVVVIATMRLLFNLLQCYLDFCVCADCCIVKALCISEDLCFDCRAKAFKPVRYGTISAYLRRTEDLRTEPLCAFSRRIFFRLHDPGLVLQFCIPDDRRIDYETCFKSHVYHLKCIQVGITAFVEHLPFAFWFLREL